MTFIFPLQPISCSFPKSTKINNPNLYQQNPLLDLFTKTTSSTSPQSDRLLTKKEPILRGNKALKKIVRGLENLHRSDPSNRVEPLHHHLDASQCEKTKQLMPWERKEVRFIPIVKKEREKMKAELLIDKEKLERLREDARKMRTWLKVKKAGVTQEIVDQIHSEWNSNDLVKIKFDVPLSRSMERAREILETKTNGLVVWTWRNVHVIYNPANETLHAVEEHRESTLFERETDRLLDGLGPRYADWWMRKPLPVDGDSLPEVVPTFRPPQRWESSKMRSDEFNYLRKLSRSLPTHFVLGRNRRLQGLAAAILELWKKCLIVKIAIKQGAQNTENEEMAKELKRLVGGTLLLRNKYYIIIYRGNDYISNEVAKIVEERESHVRETLTEEESSREKPHHIAGESSILSGTLSEFHDLQSRFQDSTDAVTISDVESENLQKSLRIEEHKLAILEKKILTNETELLKLSSSRNPSSSDLDGEILTEEERRGLEELGLGMSSRLVLGRRGVFEGVIEGLHQHWKHKEVAKVITMQRKFKEVLESARTLEAESGGVVVSIEKLKECHAIIVYRGRNYRRPLVVSDGHLLSKRDALCRSVLAQRIGSLKFFAYQRKSAISQIQRQLENIEQFENRGNSL